MELLRTIVHSSPEPLGEAIPAAVRAVVEEALAKNPAERYQATRDMVADLREITRGGAAASPAPMKRRPAWIVPGPAAAAVALGAGLWFLMRGPAELPNPLDGAKFSRLTDFPGDETVGVISPDGEWVVFASDREKPRGLWITRVGSAQFRNLTKGIENFDAGLNSWAGGFNADATEVWLHGPPPPNDRMRLMPLAGGSVRPFLLDDTFAVSRSPDGKRIAYFNNPSGVGDPVFVADADGSNAKQIFVEREGVHNHFPVWSIDGRSVYFVHNDALEWGLWRIASTGGAPEQLTRHVAFVGFPAPLDERTILFTGVDADGTGPWLWALDVETKTPRRVTAGLERYSSISASAPIRGRPRRLVAAVANPVATLWSVPILDSVAEERDAKPYPVSTARALMPRFGGTALFYLSSQGGDDALWRWEDSKAIEVWRNPSGLREPAAISPDGKMAAVLVRQGTERRLWVVGADGSQPHPVTETIDVAGSVAWSPDGQWIAAGGDDGGGPGLFKIPVAGGSPRRLTSGAARNVVWSPDDRLIVYSGANVAGDVQVLAVTPDAKLVDLPPLRLPSNGERFRFLPNSKGLIYMDGTRATFGGSDFYVLDLDTKTSRRLTTLDDSMAMRTFDVSPDGKQIIFDRQRLNSDIVLIELPAR